jgi:hypothetical protein
MTVADGESMRRDNLYGIIGRGGAAGRASMNEADGEGPGVHRSCCREGRCRGRMMQIRRGKVRGRKRARGGQKSTARVVESVLRTELGCGRVLCDIGMGSPSVGERTVEGAERAAESLGLQIRLAREIVTEGIT